MNELFNTAVGLIGLGLVGCLLLAMLAGVVKAVFSSGSGSSPRRYRSRGGDEVHWYDKSRP